MSFSPAYSISPFQGVEVPRPDRPRKPPHRPPTRIAVHRASGDHPVLFLGGFFLAVGVAVIGLWQGLGLLLPH